VAAAAAGALLGIKISGDPPSPLFMVGGPEAWPLFPIIGCETGAAIAPGAAMCRLRGAGLALSVTGVPAVGLLLWALVRYLE